MWYGSGNCKSPFVNIFHASSNEKSSLISMPLLSTYIDVRTLNFFPPVESQLFNLNFPRASRMQGQLYHTDSSILWDWLSINPNHKNQILYIGFSSITITTWLYSNKTNFANMPAPALAATSKASKYSSSSLEHGLSLGSSILNFWAYPLTILGSYHRQTIRRIVNSCLQKVFYAKSCIKATDALN